MQLYYHHTPHGNFGDDINAWLWKEIAPEICSNSDDVTLSGIGTIINEYMPESRKWIIFGSGAGYLPAPKDFGDNRWNILCVRGPLTAKVLGLPLEKAVTDSAILVSLLPQYQPVNEIERQGIAFMPHYRALKYGKWEEVCKHAGIEFLDPRTDSKELIERIRHSKLVLADAMHAAIVADSVRVPWIPLTISSETNSFKWLDWTLSMDLPYEPSFLSTCSLLGRIQDFIQSLAGLDYRFSDLKAEGAIRHYAQGLKHKDSLYIRCASFGRTGALLILKKLFQLPVVRDIVRTVDDKYMAHAVNKLRQLTAQESYLSSEDIFQKRKNEMKLRLQILRN